MHDTPGITKNLFENLNAVLLAFVFSACLITACQSTAHKDDHPEHFSAVFKQYDSTPNEHKAAAIILMDAALQSFPDAGDGDKAEVYTRKTFYNIEVAKDYVRAFAAADSLAQIGEKRLSEPRFATIYANALFKKGDVYYWLKNYDKAIEYFIMGKQVVMNQVKDRCVLSGYNGRIGNLFFKQGRYLAAAPYYLEGYYEEDVCQKDTFLRYIYMQGNLNSVATCYLYANVFDSATRYLDLAMNYLKSNENKFPQNRAFTRLAKAVVDGGYARVAEKKGAYAEAEQLYLRSIQDSRKEDIDYSNSTQLDLSEMYIRMNRLQDAETLLTHTDSSFTHSLIGSGLLRWNRLMAELFDKKKAPGISQRYLMHYVMMRDSIEAQDKKFSNVDISREFENKEQKANNQLLKKENELKSVYLVVAVVVSVLSLVIVLLVWYNLRRSSKHVKELEELNMQVERNNLSLQKLNEEMRVRNDDLQTAFTSLEQSHKENTRITRVVAHDLKNPISGIYNLVYSLLKKEQPDTLKEVLELIKDACANSITLIKDLLSEKKTLSSLRKEMVDMARLLEYCVELQQPKATEKQQQLQLNAVHANLMVNRQKMWRVISNIINNAIKFSPEHTVINIQFEKKENIVLLSVRDHGIGIPEDLRDKIFSHTAEALRPGTAGEESYGLGLSISQKIIAEHEGKLWFESEDGKGSIFYVALPYAN